MKKETNPNEPTADTIVAALGWEWEAFVRTARRASSAVLAEARAVAAAPCGDGHKDMLGAAAAKWIDEELARREAPVWQQIDDDSAWRKAAEVILMLKPGDGYDGFVLRSKGVDPLSGAFGWWFEDGGFASLSNMIGQAAKGIPKRRDPLLEGARALLARWLVWPGRSEDEVVVLGGSPEEALALSHVREITFDGHVCKDVLRTAAGVDVKTFCNASFSVPVGEKGSPEREIYLSRSKVPVSCLEVQGQVKPLTIYKH